MRRPRHITFSKHAVERMFQRGLSPAEVREVADQGEVISEYPDDVPFPSYLILGVAGGRPLHVVVAFDADGDTGIAVTAYEPDRKQWDGGLRRRRKP